jgi:hypothetical protein
MKPNETHHSSLSLENKPSDSPSLPGTAPESGHELVREPRDCAPSPIGSTLSAAPRSR